jgi:hypothetical protein
MSKFGFRELAGSMTNHPADASRHAALLRAFRLSGSPDYLELRDYILAGRLSWLDWLTVTQRKWQIKVSRRPGRCRCLISSGGSRLDPEKWQTREKYVRGTL